MASGTDQPRYPTSNSLRARWRRYRRYYKQRVPHFSKPKSPHDWHWVVAGIGKSLIVVGLLMFAFVGYQLWGTGIRTAQAQNRLEDEFRSKLESTTTTTIGATTTTTTIVPDTTVPGETTTTVVAGFPVAPPSEPVANGDPVALLRIPRIGLDWSVVEGVTLDDLEDGPGHFPESVMPGQLGNTAIAGHRTTHGHPFLELHKLKPGDRIVLTTLVGTYTYKVTGSEIVKPSEYGLVIPTIDPTQASLVLVTCDPAYTARNRLIVHARLDAEASDQVYAPPPTTTTTTPVDTSLDQPTTIPDNPTTSVAEAPDTPAGAALTGDAFSEGWFSDPAAFPHVIGWGVVLVAVGVGAYYAGRAARRLYVCFLVGAVPFVFVLYFWFENVSRLLPPGL